MAIQDEIAGKTDAELVQLHAVTDGHYHTRELAKAELIRRQVQEIRSVNIASSVWSARLFWLSVLVGLLVLMQLIVMMFQWAHSAGIAQW